MPRLPTFSIKSPPLGHGPARPLLTHPCPLSRSSAPPPTHSELPTPALPCSQHLPVVPWVTLPILQVPAQGWPPPGSLPRPSPSACIASTPRYCLSLSELLCSSESHLTLQDARLGNGPREQEWKQAQNFAHRVPRSGRSQAAPHARSESLLGPFSYNPDTGQCLPQGCAQ